MNNKKAFTLIEVMIVLMILGIIAGFAIVGFNKATYRQEAKQMKLEFTMIAAANKVYQAKHGKFWIPSTSATKPGWDFETTDIKAINAGLGINLQAKNTVHRYLINASGTSFGIESEYTDPRTGVQNKIVQAFTATTPVTSPLDN